MSTPFGRVGHFWEEWSQGRDWLRVEVPATQVTRIDPAFLEAERLSLGEAWFEQEYMCRFMMAASQVFRPEDIARSISREVEPLFAKAPAAGDVVPLFPRGY